MKTKSKINFPWLWTKSIKNEIYWKIKETMILQNQSIKWKVIYFLEFNEEIAVIVQKFYYHLIVYARLAGKIV